MGSYRINNRVNFIKRIIHLDTTYAPYELKDCTLAEFYNNYNYNKIAQEICSDIERNGDKKNVTEIFSDIAIGIDDKANTIVDKFHDYIEVYYTNGKFRKTKETSILQSLLDFYKEIGDIFDKTKILDSLINRNNKALIQNDIRCLTTNRENVMNEFTKIDRNSQDICVLLTKITFWLNKLAKYSDYSEYYTYYKKDVLNSSINNDDRIQFISKLKTDFVKDIHKEVLEHSTESTYDAVLAKIVDDYKTVYEEMFGEYFKKLDLKSDVQACNEIFEIKNTLYSSKNFMCTLALQMLAHEYNRGKVSSSIRNWGILKDNEGKYVFGMNLNRYHVGITLHLNKEYLNAMLGIMQEVNWVNVNNKIEFPKFNVLKGKNGEIFPTNILYRPTAQQREALAERCKQNPNNELLKTFNAQLNSSKNMQIDEKIIISREDIEKL